MFLTEFAVGIAELPYAPSNVRISEITATSVHISWHYDGPPSEAVEFVIQYKPKLAPTSDHSEVVGLKTNYYTVQNLNPFTEYEFYVVAVSAIGRGLASTATFVTTGETGMHNGTKDLLQGRFIFQRVFFKIYHRILPNWHFTRSINSLTFQFRCGSCLN